MNACMNACVAHPLVFQVNDRDLLAQFPAVACLITTESMSNDEIQLSVLRLLEKNPRLTQRQLSAELGVSLGKTHYIVKSLVDVGLIKLENFQRSNNKLGYAYLLTPKGIAEKAAITVRFLTRKQDDYKRLGREIEMLRSEVDAESDGAGS